NGRVITILRDPNESTVATDASATATRHSVEGFTRSLGKEMRRGATTNSIVVADGVDMDSAPAQAALRFLLSGRSAYVAGRFLTRSSNAGSSPADWDTPLPQIVIIVSGAARGIGDAVSHVLARDGATVIGVHMPAAGEALTEVMIAVGGIAV